MTEEYIYLNQCLFCNSENIRQYKKRADGLWVNICNECDLGFVEKYPKKLESLYGDDYYESSDQGVGYQNYTNISPSYFIWAIGLISLVHRKGSIFDLGCGNGLFLDLAKLYGFQVLCGNEYNKSYAEICREKGYSVADGNFLEIDIEKETFDVVTAWAVIEHIPELNRVLERIKLLLKDDGLFFFEVPCLVFDDNSDKYWFNSSLEHIYYFTENSFKKIINFHFGRDYVGRVVKFSEFGSTLVGFVSKNLADSHGNINKYLGEITGDDIGGIDPGDLLNYFAIYSRYIEGDVYETNVSEVIANHIGRNIDKNSTLTDYIIYDLFQKAKARKYHQQRSIVIEKQLHETEHRLQETEHRLQETEHRLQETEHRLQETEHRLQETEHRLQETEHRLQETEHRLQDTQQGLQRIMESKTYNLGRIFFEARHNMRLFIFTPLRITWLMLSPDLRNKVRSIYKKIRGKYRTINNGSEIKRQKVVLIKQKKWKKGPLLSVIIPCYNYGQYLEEAINSVLNQTLQEFEIIVVNDGSDDPLTLDILNHLNKPRTRVLHQENQGVIHARNNGIRLSLGKYICCLDADDTIENTYLEKCVCLLESEPHIDFAYSLVKAHGMENSLWETQDFDVSKILDHNHVSTCAVFTKRAWKKTGGYNPLMHGGYEDWDLWARMGQHGFRGRCIKEPLFNYRTKEVSRDIEARRKGEELKEIIKNNHPKLQDKKALEQIISRYKNYIVNKPFLNISKAVQYRDIDSADHLLLLLPWLIIGGSESVLYTLMKGLKEKYNFGFSIITTAEPLKSMWDSTKTFNAITKEIYHLRNFIHEQYWLDFIDNHIRTRNIKKILIVGSKYAYECLPIWKNKFKELKVYDQLYNEIGHIKNNRKYSQYIDYNIVSNTLIQDILIQQYHEEKEKIKVIIHAVDVHGEFNPEYISKTDAIPVDAVPGDRFIVGYFGRFSEEKCPGKIVDIMNALKEIDSIYFLMIGDGPEYGIVKEKIADLGLNHKVHLPGFVDDIKPYLSKTDVLVIPSKIEGIPIILLEGLSMGIPIIASNVGGIPSIITDYYNGFLCEPDDIKQFVEKVELLFNDKILKDRLSKNARSYAIENLDIDKMIKQYYDIFSEVK